MSDLDRSDDAYKDLLRRLFMSGVDAASPSCVVPSAVVELRTPLSVLLAAGKAAVEMTEAGAPRRRGPQGGTGGHAAGAGAGAQRPGGY